jgi:hypothetical protein
MVVRLQSRDDKMELRNQLYDQIVSLIDQRIKLIVHDQAPNDQRLEVDIKLTLTEILNLDADDILDRAE